METTDPVKAAVAIIDQAWDGPLEILLVRVAVEKPGLTRYALPSGEKRWYDRRLVDTAARVVWEQTRIRIPRGRFDAFLVVGARGHGQDTSLRITSVVFLTGIGYVRREEGRHGDLVPLADLRPYDMAWNHWPCIRVLQTLYADEPCPKERRHWLQSREFQPFDR